MPLGSTTIMIAEASRQFRIDLFGRQRPLTSEPAHLWAAASRGVFAARATAGTGELPTPPRRRIKVLPQQVDQIPIAAPDQIVAYDLPRYAREQVGDLNPRIGSRIHPLESDEPALIR
jgi:hypothetical protein